MRLTEEVLRLCFMQANLVATSSKQAMVQRLLDHAEDNITSDQDEQSDPATPVSQSDSEQDQKQSNLATPVGQSESVQDEEQSDPATPDPVSQSDSEQDHERRVAAFSNLNIYMAHHHEYDVLGVCPLNIAIQRKR